jgi:hypothetical protein
MVSKQKLSKLMKMSWTIQRNKRSTRSKALIAAWAILNNEEITVWYLATKLNSDKPVKPRALNQMGLFY